MKHSSGFLWNVLSLLRFGVTFSVCKLDERFSMMIMSHRFKSVHVCMSVSESKEIIKKKEKVNMWLPTCQHIFSPIPGTPEQIP
jgi:hypothetical protein